MSSVATVLPVPTSRRALILGLASMTALSACGLPFSGGNSGLNPGETPELHAMISKYARLYDMPESLIHRVIQRESDYNPAARNGPYYGLMQIALPTAQTMGYKGPANGLLDADTNLKYAGKYLRGAWLVSRGNQDKAVSWYARGYYYEAKRLGLLEETGLR
jgi:soluble lytic murein transglycosylase-like protein